MAIRSLDIDQYRHAFLMSELLSRFGIPVGPDRKIRLRDEGTASAHVYEHHIHDFGSGEHLDGIGFVGLQMFGDSHPKGDQFWKCLERIADESGLPRPKRDPDAQARHEQVQSISAVYADVYQDSLENPEPALKYLAGRKISRETTTGVVGYLPPNYQPPDRAAAIRAGLYSQKGNFLFAGRLVIPILHYGQIVGLYGRVLDDDHKLHHIYPGTTDPPMPAALWNLDHCRGSREIILVESIICALTLIDRGVKNVVAAFGTTGLTDARVELLLRTKVERIVLAYDTDDNTYHSGQKGALRAGEKLFRAGFEVQIVTLPLHDGAAKCDPNSYFQAHAAEDFENLERRDFFDVRLDAIPLEGSSHQKTKQVREIIKLVAEVGDELRDPDLLSRLKKRCPGLPIETLRKELRETRRAGFDYLPVGNDFLPDKYADAVLSSHHVIYHHSTFFFWDQKVYQVRPDLEVKRVFQKLGRGLLRKGHIDDAFHSLTIKTFVRSEIVNRVGIVNFANGYIDLMAEKPELIPHSPDLLSTIILPIAFDPQATCPMFEKFLEEKVPDPSLRALLQEITGYLLIPDTRFQKGFVFIGITRTGKSTLIRIITALIGPANRSNIPLEKIGERFHLAIIDGMLANFSSETSVDQFIEDGTVKAIIAGDDLMGERKHQSPYSFRPVCRLVVATNSPPLSHDTSNAFFRRWIPIPFNVQTPEGAEDDTLADRIIAEELPGVLLWALAGLDRLKQNGKFTTSEASQRVLEQWKRDADPVREFAHRFLHPLELSNVPLQRLFSTYNTWCKETNRKSYFTDSRLRSHLEEAGYTFKRRNTGYVLLAHDLRDEFQNQMDSEV